MDQEKVAAGSCKVSKKLGWIGSADLVLALTSYRHSCFSSVKNASSTRSRSIDTRIGVTDHGISSRGGVWGETVKSGWGIGDTRWLGGVRGDHCCSYGCLGGTYHHTPYELQKLLEKGAHTQPILVWWCLCPELDSELNNTSGSSTCGSGTGTNQILSVLQI